MASDLTPHTAKPFACKGQVGMQGRAICLNETVTGRWLMFTSDDVDHVIENAIGDLVIVLRSGFSYNLTFESDTDEMVRWRDELTDRIYRDEVLA
jgi:hypothetical protein